MSIPDDGLVGRSFDAALDQIMLLPNAEEQAQALLHHSDLLTTPRANVLMKKIAAPTTPGRKKLYDVLVAREAERARNKAAPTRRKGRGKGEGIIMPDLFVAFGAAPLSEEAVSYTHL